MEVRQNYGGRIRIRMPDFLCIGVCTIRAVYCTISKDACGVFYIPVLPQFTTLNAHQ